jgi:hypothetical protein
MAGGAGMKHKHARFIKLMADGVRIECRFNTRSWRDTCWDDFGFHDYEFRIAHDQPADEGGWIPWLGGENPAVGKRVDFKCRDGGISVSWASSTCLAWSHNGGVGDIVAYRIVKQVKKWRWMYTIANNNSTDCLYLTNAMTEAEVKEWVVRRGMTTLGPRQDWTEVECE